MIGKGPRARRTGWTRIMPGTGPAAPGPEGGTHRPRDRSAAPHRPRAPHPAGLVVLLFLGGCAGSQSMVDAANPAARQVESLWWLSLLSTGILSLLVIGALFEGVRRARRRGAEGADAEGPGAAGHGARGRAPEGAPTGAKGSSAEARTREDRWILLLGGLLPALFLVGFLIVSVRVGQSVAPPPGEPALTVEVTGHKFWWEVVYPEPGFVTANEIRIPVGEVIRVRVTAADVIHSFWVPQLSPGKVDMIPGRTNEIWMYAEEAGTYRGQCTEFCGVQHALMSLEVVAMEAENFEAWTEVRGRPVQAPRTAEAVRGLEVFFEVGCASCHAVDGRPRPAAASLAGPDLLDLMERRTLGALTLPNTRDGLAQWIVNPHSLKPGVRMPATRLEEEDLEALLDYLESLRP